MLTPRRSSRTGPTSGRTSWCRRRSCPRPPTTRSRITSSPSSRRATVGPVGALNNLPADEYVLYTKTRNYPWHAVGPQFNDLHKFFQEQYEALDEMADEVAERARSVGGKAYGSLAAVSPHARLKDESGTRPPAAPMVANLQADHEAMVRTLRADLETVMEKHNDAGTNDFLTGLMEKHEKMAWIVRSSNE